MALIVQKFGGTSVADAHHIFNVAKNIVNLRRQGNDIVVVVSAQGDTTDKLQQMANEINANASARETDALLAAGEQVSSSLLSMALQKLGYSAISLTGWQAGILTENNYGNAKIKTIDTARIEKELKNKNIVIVAGFQGVDKNGNITTLGRGGSDTSAVALAAALKADVCKIYTDVDGVYTADPRKVPSAKKWFSLSYAEMFEMAHHGAQVLHERSIKTAENFGVEIEVLSSFVPNEKGTTIKDNPKNSTNSINGISLKTGLVKFTFTGISNPDELKNKIFENAKKLGISIDKTLRPVGKLPKNSLSFITEETDINSILNFSSNLNVDPESQIFYDKNKSKISVVNISESLNINIASIIFETLSELGVEAEMVACDEKRVSIIVASHSATTAAKAIHSKLFEEDSII